MKRIVSMILALAMLLSLVSVSSVALAEGSNLEHVTIDWYVMEETKSGNQAVWDALNSYFEEKINTTVNFHYYDSTEYATRVNPILSTPQTSDMIINANSQLSYVNNVQQENFLALEDLLPVYAPKTWEMIPEGFWDAMKINGHIYGIPSYKDSAQMNSLLINETLAAEIGMDLSNVKINNYLEDVVPLLYEAYEKNNGAFYASREFPDQDQWFPVETINGLAVVNVPGVESYAGKGTGEIVFNKYATDEYRAMCNAIAKMVADGILPEDVWNFDTGRIYTDEGRYFSYGVGSGYMSVAKNTYSDEWDYGMIPYATIFTTTNYIHNAVNCISVNSEHPDRVLMLLELLNTDPYVATTIRFGMEGTYWNQSSEAGVMSIEGTMNQNRDANWYWYGAQFGSIAAVSVVPPGNPADYIETLIAANDRAVTDTNIGFIFDPTPVQNEIAACNSAIGEYEINLKFGFIAAEDVDSTIDEFLAKLEASGAQKIVDEAQKQLDAWRAENK